MIDFTNNGGRPGNGTRTPAMNCRIDSIITRQSVLVRSKLAGTEQLPTESGEVSAQASPAAPSRSVAGFTLIEMLIVVTIILVIAGLLTPAINKMMEVAARQRAATRCQAVVLAVKQYKNMYQKWPGQTEQGVDGSIDQELIIPALMSNPRGEILVDVLPDWTNSTGELMDIWEQQCHIVMDEDEDGIVQVVDANLMGEYPITTTVTNASVVVISWGPKPAIEGKRIYSWRH
jgi:prepilin-type N-terminal cleavage/methylation domain-containing protein